MIVLDTNVLSEMMREGGRDDAVDSWLDRQPHQSLWITAITIFEIRFGIELLERGRRRQKLEDMFLGAVREDFQGRTLSFEQADAEAAAGFAARRRAAGIPVEFRDVQIAGIVAARQATLATRNIRHFEDFKISLINPWS